MSTAREVKSLVPLSGTALFARATKRTKVKHSKSFIVNRQLEQGFDNGRIYQDLPMISYELAIWSSTREIVVTNSLTLAVMV